MKIYYLHFKPDADVNYLHLFSLYDLADYNPATKAYDTINYTSIPKLAALLPYSNSTLNRILVNDEYKDFLKFVRLHNRGTQRGQDIFFEYFGSGYSFVINNPKCKSIVIGETVVPVTEIPFVYYYPFTPNEYYFLDADGNKLN